ncbi:cobalamin adenosyltransferase [Lachnoclostridium phytofermentans]|uniref:Cobalamin adenosyltransferase n=1 Tax=Lachnoclostridium phytofermentans (strain ATCC 700394 / DSM 18823 / ISDg) TaxID=357809 RepID=A9KMZ0_LACP7|nr:cobalamin adenosyltransferase [Lachnoclostridium phytofermentans]ABX43001.1 cobalamin adenosyltransferase [Lachnoclostridium phytofermentans ISDg]
MALITEQDIRKMVSDGLLKEKGEFHLGKDTILTPSARAYLLEKNITLLGREYHNLDNSNQDKTAEFEGKTEKKTNHSIETNAGFDTVFGVHLEEKPEHMTHLRGNLLVFKDHKRIVLRGAIDYLESEIIIAQTVSERLQKPMITKELEEVIRFIRKLLQCEITGEAVPDFMLAGLDEKDLREQSYHPSKYFGMKHFLPTYKHGEMTAYLNKLRTLTRKTEIVAFKAFKAEDGTITREDIIRAFNRLSSFFWIMMFKYLTGKYDGV